MPGSLTSGVRETDLSVVRPSELDNAQKKKEKHRNNQRELNSGNTAL